MTTLMLALLLAQAPAAQEVKPATLEGVVTHAGTQTPIRKAKVSLTPVGSQESASSIETGEDGKFTLKDVKPGRYRLTAERTGYETTAYGARRAGDASGQVLRVDPAASLTGLAIALPKQGVIAGKILDGEGEPVAKTLVLALNNVYVAGKKIRLPAGTVTTLTNDLGEYRISQLPPGKYIVCAIPESSYQPAPASGEGKATAQDAIAVTCFPNLPQMTSATEFEIKDAAELPGVDIRMIKTRTVNVKGRVTGMPANAGSITILNLTPKDSGPMGRALGPRALLQASDGRFEFRNVPAGSYILQTLPTGLGNLPFVVKAPIEIGEQPMDELLVAALTPFEVKAHVDAEPSSELKLQSIRVALTPADGIQHTFALGSPGENGDLALANLVPGLYKVTIASYAPSYYVKELRLGEQIVQGDEVEISSPATPLNISLGIAKAEVTGLARNAKGDLTPAAYVGLIPDPRRPYRIKATRTDQNGAFRLANVPAGEYLLLAFDQVEAGSLEDEDFLKPFLAKAKRVKVEESGGQSANLSVLAAKQ